MTLYSGRYTRSLTFRIQHKQRSMIVFQQAYIPHISDIENHSWNTNTYSIGRYVQCPGRRSPDDSSNKRKRITGKAYSLPPKFYTNIKHEEIRKEINNKRKLNVIKPSQATEWSQTILASKPNGGWRFCTT